MKCDFDVRAPEVPEGVRVNRAEVASNAEVYGALIVWQLLANPFADDNHDIVEALYHTAVDYARTGEALGGAMGQEGDWHVCPKHLKDWQVFKEMLLKRV